MTLVDIPAVTPPTGQATSPAREYATAIMNRGRVPMEPIGFVPDWSDRPRKWKHYAGADAIPLPDAPPDAPPRGTVREALFGPSGHRRRDEPFTLELLGGMLRDSYGLLGRRLGVQANTDMATLPAYTHANWHRGAASGGGLYPVSVYLVSGPSGPLAPGVRHYSPAHHSLHTLLLGDATTEVSAALGERGPSEGSDHFLVLGAKMWQNAFKYNSFSFHAVSMDVGAAVQAMRSWARAAGLVLDPTWWFDEPRLARLLGLGEGEPLFAVIPLRWEGGREAPAGRGRSRAPAPGPAVTRREQERSRRTFTFGANDDMVSATRASAAVSDLSGLAAASVPRRPGRSEILAEPLTLEEPLRTTLRSRRSSFGRFDGSRPLPLGELATVLEAAARAAADTLPVHGPVRDRLDGQAAGIYAFVNHVEGVAPGVYAAHGGALHLLEPGPPGRFLQDNYFLANYNLEQAGAVIVPTVRTAAVLDAVGDRGYLLVNATIGAIAQASYTAAAARGVGCGVALGFDSVSYVEKLDLGRTGEVPLLLMMVGHERPGSASFRYEIV